MAGQGPDPHHQNQKGRNEMKTSLYVYKTKQGFGGLLKDGLICKIITHIPSTDK
jgi:hypothetical protein